MSEKLKSPYSPQSTEQREQHRHLHNVDEFKDRRGLKAVGVGALATALVAGGLFVGSKFYNNAEAEPTPEPTATEDTVDHDPTAADPTEAAETLSLENFPYTLNGETYVGIEAFSEALAISTTPVDEYPGTFMSEERNEAIQEDFQAGMENWVGLADQFINYELAPEYYSEEYDSLSYQDSKGRYFDGEWAVLGQFVAPAFERAMLHDSSVANTAYPSEFMEDLTYTASLIGDHTRRSTEDGETPYESHLVIEDMQFGGVELVGHADYEGQSTGISGGGTVTLRLDSNQGEGNTVPFDLLGGVDQDVDYFSTTEPFTWRVEASAGTGQFKAIDIETRE